jgi:hypothetical protein
MGARQYLYDYSNAIAKWYRLKLLQKRELSNWMANKDNFKRDKDLLRGDGEREDLLSAAPAHLTERSGHEWCLSRFKRP